jgi:Rha family phage regulatory protein
MASQISSVLPEITIHNGRAVTTSIAVANYFQKEHKNVLQKIRALECSPAFTTANFSAVVVNVQAGFNERETEAYEMTRNGFIFLVMGFTGKKASAFKEAYIAEFDRMEAELTKQPSTAPAVPIFPVTSDFSYLTTVERGHVVDIRIVMSGQILAHYSDFIEMVQRTGSVVIDEAELRSLSSEAIMTLCEAARQSRYKWEKLHSRAIR